MTCHFPLKGEFVLTVAGNAAADSEVADAGLSDALLRELVAVLPGRQAAEIVSRVFDASRNDIYQRMLEIKDGNS